MVICELLNKDAPLGEICPIAQNLDKYTCYKECGFIFKQKKTNECTYNYHQDEHEEVCQFECTLDGFLEPDSQLTQDAQEYRDKLIVGVERMMKKIEDYKTAKKGMRLSL